MIDVAVKVFGCHPPQKRNQRTRPKQSGLWPECGCTDQMHNLRRTLEHRWSFQQATASLFNFVLQGPPMVDNDRGWNDPQTIGADQGALLVDQDEGRGKWE